MPRTRAKSPPRLTRDAERLIALALGLNASGSLTEDRYWEGELAARLADAAVSGEVPRLDFARLPETAHLLADTRFLIACAAVPRGQPLFRWQEDASGHVGRAGSLEQWITQARPTLAKMLPGCV